MTRTVFLFCLFIAMLIQGNAQTNKNYLTVNNSHGPVLGYSPASGVKILTIKGLHFKDLNRNGKLDKFEDWRLPVEERAKDLAAKMSIEEIAGLMLYSQHQSIPAAPVGFGAGTYHGKPFDATTGNSWELSDQQKQFLKEDHLRHILITKVQSPEVAARWNNEMQAYAESLDLGIPGNNSSDPRNTASATSEFNAGAGGTISLWPDGLAMAATFDPSIVQSFGETAAREYRALGISTALSPQVDLGSEPRWFRIAGTFGEGVQLNTDLARAYIDGFQTSKGADEIKDGWGYASVNAMVKHWPGGGPEEAGRDAHWAYGKFAVYPGNNLKDHLKAFTEGAFKLNGPTGKSAAVMPYYTISYQRDTVNGLNVGNGYSKYLITDLLRGKYGYDGVVCTDWLITANEGAQPQIFAGKPWGMELKSIAERHFAVLMAGVDQFGGNNDKGPVLEAYRMGVAQFGETYMRKRFEQSAVRLLKNIFRVGLFENPYLDPDQSKMLVGNPGFMQRGYQAQLKSVVLLKNKNQVLPQSTGKTVYIPKIYYPPVKDWWGNMTAARLDYPVELNLVKKYYMVTDDPNKADFVLVFVNSPQSLEAGYDPHDRKAGGNGYVPISLQYNTYTASDAREHSIAAGDPAVDPSVTDRSYKGKTVTVNNTMDLRTILDTKDAMKDKPVIVVVSANKPMVVSEFEKSIEGLVMEFGVSRQAVLDIISGKAEPSGLLPVQLPANMQTVEKQLEDVPRDMECHKDSEGHIYDFGYGLSWKGVIVDDRTRKYAGKQ